MSKRKPKAKRPTRGELYMEKVYGPWMRLGQSGRTVVTGAAILAVLKKHWAEQEARWNEEAHGPRAVPDDCPRPMRGSIADAAEILGVNAHSTKFIERFIASGWIAANHHARQTWTFDLDELERVACELEDAKKATRKRSRLH